MPTNFVLVSQKITVSLYGNRVNRQLQQHFSRNIIRNSVQRILLLS